MFELSQLRCFVAVAEELHFGRAAARLNMTQPPLSRQVQLLEHALDILLLARTSRSVQLTPAGRAFLPDARRILQLADGAGLTARRVARGEAGSIMLGCTAAASYGLLPRLVAFTTAQMPGIDLVLKEMVTAEQMEALAVRRARPRLRAPSLRPSAGGFNLHSSRAIAAGHAARSRARDRPRAGDRRSGWSALHHVVAAEGSLLP